MASADFSGGFVPPSRAG